MRGATGRPVPRVSVPEPADEQVDDQPATSPSRFQALMRQGSSLTTRALALGVVLLVLTISYASSLRVYFDQRHDIAATRAEIAAHNQAIGELTSEVARWNDPAFVRSQAHQRLGWVVPGETGYKVIGPDGKTLSSGSQIDGAPASAQAVTVPWWSRLFSTLQMADHPAAGQQGGPPAAPSPKPTVVQESPSGPSTHR